MPSFKRQTPHLFAHRGSNATGKQNENTRGAFQDAVAKGCQFLETDVIMTKDKQVITYHGSHNILMKKIYGLETRNKVQKLTLTQLQKKLRSGKEPIPRFEDMLTLFDAQCFSVDVKTKEVVEPLVSIIKKHRAENRVIITSFNKNRSIAAGRLLYGENFNRASLCVYRTKGWLISFFPSLTLKLLKTRGFGFLQIPHRCVNKRLIDKANETGIYIYPWTVNKAADMKRLLGLRVHGIISDEIDLLLRMANNYKQAE